MGRRGRSHGGSDRRLRPPARCTRCRRAGDHDASPSTPAAADVGASWATSSSSRVPRRGASAAAGDAAARRRGRASSWRPRDCGCSPSPVAPRQGIRSRTTPTARRARPRAPRPPRPRGPPRDGAADAIARLPRGRHPCRDGHRRPPRHGGGDRRARSGSRRPVRTGRSTAATCPTTTNCSARCSTATASWSAGSPGRQAAHRPGRSRSGATSWR